MKAMPIRKMAPVVMVRDISPLLARPMMMTPITAAMIGAIFVPMKLMIAFSLISPFRRVRWLVRQRADRRDDRVGHVLNNSYKDHWLPPRRTWAEPLSTPAGLLHDHPCAEALEYCSP